MREPANYEARVRALENEGLTRSDAQGVVDAEILRGTKPATGGMNEEMTAHYSQIVGAKITAFCPGNGYPSYQLVMPNGDIKEITIARDAECNGPGFMFIDDIADGEPRT